ncbi:hypothetical protein ACTHR6_18085 [Ralstonia holmesii]|uniref:Transmembrane protein n=1 Tax=Ralstonia holmesii TaxID=3058602 RepID=A0ABC8QL26_9RALS|nr:MULTISPECIES: hypothetical protein [Ralstonia]CAJ0804334.1 hypothetical protein LMG18096_04434 [Ralstonia sp. LMG 32967]CAJ0822151.1 hypothetical protein LMG18093_04939 [Ralstonia sp. LMG 32967]
MSDFEREIASSRRLFRPRFSVVAAVTALFSGLAKGGLALLFVFSTLIAAIFGGPGATDLPTTRRDWRILLLFAIVVVVGVFAWHRLKQE